MTDKSVVPPVKAWLLPSGGYRAYMRCRRLHRRWRSGYDTPFGKQIDCARCGLRWTW